MATINGTNSPDNLYVSLSDSFVPYIINGFDGNDTITGGYSNDSLLGGLGNDTIDGGGRGRLSGDDTIDGKEGNDTINGKEGDDSILGGAGNDTIYGGDRNDTLIGGAGTDIITSGLGNDVFKFNSVSESQPGVLRDVITDFVGNGNSPGDRIDLSSIDGNSTIAGKQAFTFIGASALSAPGQVRYSGGILQANTDRNLSADFEIQLVGRPQLVASDINLSGTFKDSDFNTFNNNDFSISLGPGSSASFSSSSGQGFSSSSTGSFLIGNGGISSNKSGNDILTGDTGNETLNGGSGNDILNGGSWQ